MYITRRLLLGASVAGAALATGCVKQAAAPDFASLLNEISTSLLKESPEYATSLAVSEEQAGGPYMNRLSDASLDGFRAHRTLLQDSLAKLRALDRDKLSDADKVSLDVVSTSFDNDVAADQFEAGAGATAPYIVSQLTGVYTFIPDFLDSQHPITSRAQADAYIERLSGYAKQLDQETARIAPECAAGFTPPDFAIDKALGQLSDFAKKKPADTVLVQSLARRIADVAEVAAADRTALAQHAEAIVRDEVLPAYARQIAALQAVRPTAVHDAGAYRLPRGDELYAAALRNYTTTEMTPDEIHNMGVELVQSINGQIDTILKAQGMTRGSIAERVAAISKRPGQLYPNTDAGRTQLLADLNKQVQAIRARMPEVCGVLAKADLQIKRVPEYTQAGAPGGYYNGAALDGSRPGSYYINLRDTHEWPKFTLPTLTYHEGIPGHHWQISIAQESTGLPFIRSALLGFNAYAEGWGLYAEQLADEMGMYADDPFGRVGYLQSAAFRASRLVVDTGMHAKRWTREQAIASMKEATGDQDTSIATEIERYAVWPGQACGYMVGRQFITKLREDAKTTLGAKFDIKGFHDTVLTNGSLPLSVLESLVKTWVAQRQAAA
jgi:uncharacterized protein (DUF885 family)